jgi:uncharacterized protein YbcC (UPF0753/DUF2309 family)
MSATMKMVVLLLRRRICVRLQRGRFTSCAKSHSDKLRVGPVSPIASAVGRATIILPHQSILENFVHHNPFQEVQHLEFRDAIQYMQTLETYASPGERVLHLTGIDPRKREKGALVDLSAVFLDRGATKWTPGFRDQGFLFFFASLEGLGFAPWRRHARKRAREILVSLKQENADPAELSEQIIQKELENFGIPPEDWDSCVRSMLANIRGWAGMFHHMETHPHEAPLNTRVSLIELCAAQAILSRAAIEMVASQSGWDDAKTPLALWLRRAPTTRNHPVTYGSVRELSVIADNDQTLDRLAELEKTYEQKVINAIAANLQMASPGEEQTRPSPQMQFIACIDDREGSLRRHLEEADSTIEVETFGVAGFFGLPMSYKSIDAHVAIDVTPHGKPIWNVVDADHENLPGSVAKYKHRRRYLGQVNRSFEAMSFSPVGSLLLSALAPLYFGQLVLMGYAPLWNAAIWDSLFRPVKPKTRVAFTEPVSPSAAASVLAGVFKSTGICRHFSPLVVILGHGASSYNNPYSAAYNCGACGGHSGGGNARVFAHLANDLDVRACLYEEHNMSIPQQTVFVAGEHDTTADNVILSNEDDIPPSHLLHLRNAKRLLSEALGKNALERCHRFLLSEATTPKDALRHVRQRSVDFAEARPELNHAANAAVIVGRRSLTRGSFFDRRKFLPSYDPYLDDDEGTQLESVLAPALNVCSGINLEYLFSTIAIDRHGAGSKAPLNAVSNIGVQHGTYGDLRTGLPSQMVEMHVPLRAIYVVDSHVSKVEAVFKRRPDLEVLVRNNWVHMVVREPSTGDTFHYIDGAFVPFRMETTGKRERLTVNSEWAAFKAHRDHGMSVKNREDIVYGISTIAMLASLCGPLLLVDSAAMMNPHGAVTAACATGLALPVLAFSRRYLHGEYLFTRFSFLSSGLLLGFNLVATAPCLEQTVAGWGLFGFASAFLIGSYNDRPSVRNNAVFAFAAYRVSDFALLTAMAFASPHAAEAGHSNPELVAGCLLLAAMFKSSQIPLTALFARSMEGPTPTSALGYAGLSAHVGVVLLASTVELWFPFDEARIGLATIGASTALYSGLVSQIHADRKGALAYATSSTLGAIYVVMAAGYINEALALALGHASFRILQVLESPGSINAAQSLTSALDAPPWPSVVPDSLFRLCWGLHRLDTDAHAVNTLHQVSAMLGYRKPLKKYDLSQPQLWGITGAGLAVAGLPFTPVSEGLHILLEDLLITDPALASCVMLSHLGVSVLTMRFLLLNILSPRQEQSVNQISLMKAPHVSK